MCEITSRLRDERGVGVVAVLLLILILALLGTVMVALTVQEMDAGLRHTQSEQALMVAEAGLQYAQAQFTANSAWTGLAEPGRAVGRGHFIVIVNTTDADGTTVASGTKVLHAIGLVGNARREVVSRAVAGSGTPVVVTLYARAQGNALSFSAPQGFTDVGYMVDAGGTNAHYGIGTWQDQQQAVVTNWQGGTVTGTVTQVELRLYGYVSGSLTDDYATARLYLNNLASGSAVTIPRATLNTRVGSSSVSLGPWTVDLTAARSWTAADFAGDLELLLGAVASGSSDGQILAIDAVALRVTTGGAATTFNTYREVIS